MCLTPSLSHSLSSLSSLPSFPSPIQCSQGHEARLQDLQEERQRRREEQQAKEEAALVRVKAGWCLF